MRTCVVTKEKYPKRELVRIVRTPENEVKVDTTGRMNGHGAYIKLDRDVIIKAQSTKVLDRTLKVIVPNEVYEELHEMLK